MGVKIDDIILFEIKCKFYYKEYEVTVRKINNIVDVGIMLFHIESKIGYIEKMYKSLVEEGVANDSKVMVFENN